MRGFKSTLYAYIVMGAWFCFGFLGFDDLCFKLRSFGWWLLGWFDGCRY